MSPKKKQNNLQFVPNTGTIVPEMGTTVEKTGLLSGLFSKTRQSVLSVLYSHTDETFYLRQLSRIAGIKMGALQRELKQLTDKGIINRKEQGNQVYFQANKECPIFDELKSIVVKTVGIGDVLRVALTVFADDISVAFIYGSLAEGTEHSGSDVDILIVGNISLGAVVSALQDAQHIIGREINPTIYSASEFQEKVRANHHFLRNVLDSPKIFLIGDDDELERLA